MRSILITGANGGLGLGIGRYFLENEPDAKVWLGVRSNRANADALAAEFPKRCETVDLEVTSKESWEAAVKTILDTDGRLDVLVNNAGLHRDHLLAAMPDEAWSDVISTNLDSVFLGCRAVVRPMMAQRFGRIVNIASLSAILPPLGQTNYAAAKAGVVALTQTLAKEVARAGITVNAVLPGYIATEALSHMDEEAAKRAKAGIPMRRFGTPEEVACAVRFLACQDAAYVTGSALKIDGGILNKLTIMAQGAELRQKIKETMVEELMLDFDASEIADGTPIFGAGGLGLDSVDALQLVVAIEKQFGLKIADAEKAKGVLQSVETIAKAIEEKA